MLLWNVEGLRSVLRTMPVNILDSDIIILTETFLTREHSIEGYYMHHVLAHQGERGRPSGGIACFIKPWLSPCKTTYQTANTLIVQTKSITVISGYFQPECTAEFIIDELSEAIAHIDPRIPTVLAGDFNCRTDKPNTKSTLVLDYITETGMALINDKSAPTYIAPNGTSVIDLVFVNNKIETSQKKIGTHTATAPMRKHLPLEVTMNIAHTDHSQELEGQCKIKRTLNQKALQKAGDNIASLQQTITQNDIETAAQHITRTITAAQTTYTQHKRRAQVWFDAECYRKRTEVLTLLHRARDFNEMGVLQEYSKARRNYKCFLRDKRAEYLESEARKIAEEALKDPYIALRPKRPTFANTIQMSTWEEHFSKIINQKDINNAFGPQERGLKTADFPLITNEEVAEAIRALKNNKSPGPDTIYNEHLKETYTILGNVWTQLFNKCIELGQTPESWREATLKILYKGKGDTNSTDSYRGIALQNTIYKLFAKILTSRLTRIIEEKLPENQFGFRKNRSTIHALRNLLNEVTDTLREPRVKLFAVFIDFSKAFDCINRTKLLQKLQDTVGEGSYLLPIIQNILQTNYVTVDDNIKKSHRITQTNGVPQGDCLSPLLFNVATIDVNSILHGLEDQMSLYVYADDMVITSRNIDALQQGFNALTTWARKNDLDINKEKTVTMVFRKGGRIKTGDCIRTEQGELEKVGHFKYLGITLQTTGTTFKIHVKERAAAALRAVNEIKSLTLLSVDTAVQLFNAKIVPIITYGIELLWEHLKISDLRIWESVKASFLKRILAVSRFTSSRLVYVLTREQFFLEELRMRYLLPSTKAYEQLLQERRQKRDAIPEEFYGTPAMIDRSWSGPNKELRHQITRYAVHGFHHKVCVNDSYHEIEDACRCKLCGLKCTRYHLELCSKVTMSLAQYAK